MENSMRVLITGASSGIGREFALQYAAAGHDLVLVARNAERLHALAADVHSQFGVDAQVLAADLSNRAQLTTVEERLRSDSAPIDLLVNNAGFGTTTSFGTADLSREQEMLEVLVVAVMRLTAAALPNMIKRRSGGVIVVSSVAGWMPGGTYSAAKAWATTFVESIAGELRKTGVSAMALCPGFTVTEFHERAGIEREAVPRFLWLDVRDVVASAIRDYSRGKVVCTPSLRYKALGLFMRTLPRWIWRALNVGLSGPRR
jgi:short-subunit dehydrogenase